MKRLHCLCRVVQHQSIKRLLKISFSAGLALAAVYGTRGQQPASPRPKAQQPARSPQPAQTPQPSSPQATPSPPPSVSAPWPSPAKTPSPVASPTPSAIAPSPQPSASPQPGASPQPSLPASSPLPFKTPAAAAFPAPPVSLATAPTEENLNPLTLDEALRLANVQASSFQQAGLNEQIAAQEVRQAQAAFLPRVTAPVDYIYTSPLLGAPLGTPRTQSFIAANAINEYLGLLNLAGDLDIAGRLRATLERNRALLAAAHAGTEVARRALAQTVIETYYGLALTIGQRRAAEQNLAAAEEFERITTLLLSGGEVAPVDLTRAQLQTTGRRDELERARANEVVAAGALRVLVGYDFLKPISTTDLTKAIPVDDEVNRLTADTISRRPEFAQFEAERRAAEQDIRLAKAERRPQLSYSISGGFDTDSLKPPVLKEHTGVSAAFNLSIPIFDWGASKSRERQARLRAELAESQRAQALRGFAQQFYSARAQVTSASARIRLAATGLAQAESNLNASIARYRTGEAQILEVTDAETTLAAQRQALYQALFDYQTALARLRQAAGQ
jgi:outer membrane protein TolC